jgi:hypothetical protein
MIASSHTGFYRETSRAARIELGFCYDDADTMSESGIEIDHEVARE